MMESKVLQVRTTTSSPKHSVFSTQALPVVPCYRSSSANTSAETFPHDVAMSYNPAVTYKKFSCPGSPRSMRGSENMPSAALLCFICSIFQGCTCQFLSQRFRPRRDSLFALADRFGGAVEFSRHTHRPPQIQVSRSRPARHLSYEPAFSCFHYSLRNNCEGFGSTCFKFGLPYCDGAGSGLGQLSSLSLT
jgi:hypothetical protein